MYAVHKVKNVICANIVRLWSCRLRLGEMRPNNPWPVPPPRKPRFSGWVAILLIAIFTILLFCTRYPRQYADEQMQLDLAHMRDHIRLLETMYSARREELITLQNKTAPHSVATMAPDLQEMLTELAGTKAAEGANPRNLETLPTPIAYQLLPHLMEDPNSMRPAYHMSGGRMFSRVVIGITTVRRDKESYLMITLRHLVSGLQPEHLNSTMIVVYVGETDLRYVIDTARKIEIAFPTEVTSGLIEVLAPAASYYPDFEKLQATLGDSKKRFRWRTKANLDTMFLMAYVQNRGTYYLMLEDDIIPKKDYMQTIREFTSTVSVKNPHWFFIEFCATGGIGKLFRSADLLHFITYVQLFYVNQPIDWLLESYLADRVCTIDKTSKNCSKHKDEIRPKYKSSLFKHIGLFSSLKGKIQRVDLAHYGQAPAFYPHSNPPLRAIVTDISAHQNQTLQKAYLGLDFFWGVKPHKDDVIEFQFEKPVIIEKYLFRTGNVAHKTDKLTHAVVEVQTEEGAPFAQVGAFDEFGLAEGHLPHDLGSVHGLRIRVTKDCQYWVILSEIDIKVSDQES